MARRSNGKKGNGHEAKTFEQWQSGLTQNERRLDDIVQKMLAGAWLPGVSDRAFAKEWAVTPGHVRRLSAEANRQIRKQLREDPEACAEAKAELLQTFRVIRAKGMLAAQTADNHGRIDTGGLRVALEATKALGTYLGLEPPRRVQVSESDPFADWSDEQLERFADTGERPDRSAMARLNGGNGETRH